MLVMSPVSYLSSYVELKLHLQFFHELLLCLIRLDDLGEQVLELLRSICGLLEYTLSLDQEINELAIMSRGYVPQTILRRVDERFHRSLE